MPQRESFIGRRAVRYAAEHLEARRLLSGASPATSADWLATLTTTASSAAVTHAAFPPAALQADDLAVQTAQSSPLIHLDSFRLDPQFAGIDGSGLSVVVLDTGIDLNHPFFGPDANANGVADRIVYNQDFATGAANAEDGHGHGSNVASIIGSQDTTYGGVAPGVNLIVLKVLDNAGFGSFAAVETALQWVVSHVAAYNIVAVNMSLSDGSNRSVAASDYGIGDELAALAGQGVVVVSAAGNSYYNYSGTQGVGYPAADPNSFAVGAVWDSNVGGPFQWSSGATDFTTGADRITSFSQRDGQLTDVFAPGAPITGAGANGSIVTYAGTSQAAPHVAGVVALAQELAQQELGRHLTISEFRDLVRYTGTSIVDGDDEDDNVTNTGLAYSRVDVHALGQAIVELGTIHVVSTSPPIDGSTPVAPTSFVIDFSEPYLASSVQAGDLLVNGLPAGGVQFTDADTLTFTFVSSPVVAQGLQTMSIAAGAIQSVGGEFIEAASGSFRYDVLPMQVTAVSPVAGTTVALPLTAIQIDLNEAYAVGSVGLDDLDVSIGQVVGYNLLDADSVLYLISGIEEEGSLTATFAAGALADSFGNPLAPFTATWTLDAAQVEAQTPTKFWHLNGLNQVSYNSGIIQSATDVDKFALDLLPGQRLSFVLSASAGLRATVAVLDPDGTAVWTGTASAAGATLVANGFYPVKQGAYLVSVAGVAGTQGDYELSLALNVVFEAESYFGSDNGTLATAENLTPSLGIVAGGGQTITATGSIGEDVVSVGPDGYGYEAVVVPYEFNDISTTGTELTLLTNQDDAVAILQTSQLPGFYFSLYGVTYPTVSSPLFVSSNGLLNLGAPHTSGINSDLTQTPTNAAIAALWDNLVVSGTAQSKVYYKLDGSGSSQRLIVQWNKVRYVGASSSDTITFQVVLNESGNTVQINYLDLDSSHTGSGGASATVGTKAQGFQQGQFTNRLVVSYDAGPNDFVGTGKSIKLGVGVLPPPEVDYYRLDLAAGDRVTIGATGGAGGGLSLELRSAADATLATGAWSENLNLVIDSYTVATAGTYYVRLTGARPADYALTVTRNATFDVEAHNDLANAQPLGPSGVAIGATGYGTVPSNAPGSPVPGAVDLVGSNLSLGFATDGSLVGPTVGARHNGVEYLKFGQALAAYTVAYNGGFYTNGGSVAGTDFAVTRYDISSGSQHGLRMTGTITAGVTFERVVSWQDGDNYAIVTTTITNNTGATLAGLALLENHDPDPGGVAITSNDVEQSQGLVTAGTMFNGHYALGSLDPRALASVEGLIVTDPFAVLDSPVDPNGLAEDLNINLAFRLGSLAPGQKSQSSFAIVMGDSKESIYRTYATAAQRTLPASDDYYSVALAAGDVLTINTSTPGGEEGQVSNLLNPAIDLYAPGGLLVASDDNSAADGKNALVAYAATVAGTYTVRVRAIGGTAGDYVLVANTGPDLTVSGHTTGVPYQPRTLSLSASDTYAPDNAGVFSIAIDWDGDGSFDEIVSGSPGLQVDHTFTATGVFNVRMQATDVRGAAGPVVVWPMTIVAAELQPDDQTPGLTNLAWGGTANADQIALRNLGGGSVELTTTKYGGQATNLLQNFAGVTGRVLAFAGEGNDRVDGALLGAIRFVADAGAGNDTLTGGDGADSLLGGQGNDVVQAGAGDDFLWGDGSEFADGKPGDDTLDGGAGHDTIIADGAEGGDDIIYGQDGDDSIFAGGGNDWVDGGANDDRIVGGDGAEGSNDTLFGGAGNDYLDGGVGSDLTDGGDGRDLLVSGAAASSQSGGDTVSGGADDDILVAGSLGFAVEQLEAAVDAVLAEWGSSHTYATRVANLLGPGSPSRLNGTTYLLAGTTVLASSVADTLSGGTLSDWFFYNLAEDVITDQQSGETLTLLP
ncbi:MAG: S8 family serine peptidase [Pirellulales bacterium]|nr:S8 family serine peptidase [Pirellulales bacterium]